jgi:hypothetical protein
MTQNMNMAERLYCAARTTVSKDDTILGNPDIFWTDGGEDALSQSPWYL